MSTKDLKMQQAGVEQELRALGLYDNPHYFLNTEYAESGTINATEYDGNYIFVHGVNAFYEASFRGMVRPGLKKPLTWNPKKGRDEPTKDKSVEVSYDKDALQSLVRKANAVAQTFDPPFNVVGPVPVRRKSDIDYQPALTESIVIPVSEEYQSQDPQLRSLQGAPLQRWLTAISQKPAQYYAPHYDVAIPTLEGKIINPYHKNTYVSVIEGRTNVDSIVAPEHVKKLIDGIIMLHATRKLGHQFLLGLTSDFGDLISSGVNRMKDHEGVVIRNSEFGSYPFKITGEFIVTGMLGAIAQKMGATNENIIRISRQDLESLITNIIRF
jgi:hypothetical protein